MMPPYRTNSDEPPASPLPNEAHRLARKSAYTSIAVSVATLVVGWGVLVPIAIYLPVLGPIMGLPLLFLPAGRALTISMTHSSRLSSALLSVPLVIATPFLGIWAFDTSAELLGMSPRAIPIVWSWGVSALLPLIGVHVVEVRRLKR